MSKALVVVDLQKDYFFEGKMELESIEEVLAQTNKLIKFARKEKMPIFFIQHIALTRDATFFIPDTNGVELIDDLDIKDDLVIQKNYPNSFRETLLHSELQKRDIKELIVCGAMTHMCIDTTVRAGFDLGYHICLVYDACTTKDLHINGKHLKAKDVHDTFMAAMNGVFCKVLTFREITN